jgi:benzoyl-CoA reductase/2-hydroxyglutaryl-CoA dehydratase subunit BcrC/BadD/HgdB
MPPFSGLLFPGNTCDSLQNVGDVWRFRFPQDRVLRLTYPASQIGEHSIQFFAEELRALSPRLKEISREDFSSTRFRQACSTTTEARAALQMLYASRALDPSVLSYGHLAELLRMFLALPDAECLRTLKTELSRVTGTIRRRGLLERATSLRTSLLERDPSPPLSDRPSDGGRFAVIGGMTEPKAIADLFESAVGDGSSSLVFDLLSLGYKTVFTPEVDGRGDPYLQMARSTLGGPAEPTREGLIQRMKDLRALLKGLYIDGLVVCEQSFCDPDEFEAPSIEKTCTDAGVACLRLPLDPELSDRARLEGRIQTFMETVQGGD